MNDEKKQLDLLGQLTNISTITISSLAILLNQHKNLEPKKRKQMLANEVDGFDNLIQSYQVKLEELTLFKDINEKNFCISVLEDLRELVGEFSRTINDTVMTSIEKSKRLTEIGNEYNAKLTLVNSFVKKTIAYSNSYLKKKIEDKEITKEDLISILNSVINKDIKVNIENLIREIERKERKNQPEPKKVVSDNNQNEVENKTEKVENTTRRERRAFSNAEPHNLDTLDDIVRNIEYDPKHMGAYVNKIMIAICEEKISNAKARIKEIERAEMKFDGEEHSLWDDIKLRSLEHQKKEWYKVIEESEEQLENISNGLGPNERFSKYATKLLKKIQKNEAKLLEEKAILSKISDKNSEQYTEIFREKEKFEERLKRLRSKKDAKIVGCASSISLTLQRRKMKIGIKSNTRAFAQEVLERFKRRRIAKKELENATLEGASEITKSEEEKSKSK